MLAAGSSLARNAARVGFLLASPWILASVSLTSVRRFLEMVSAVMTLQVFGVSCVAMAVYLIEGAESVTSLLRVCVSLEASIWVQSDDVFFLRVPDEP